MFVFLFINSDQQVNEGRDKASYRSGRDNPEKSFEPIDIRTHLRQFRIDMKQMIILYIGDILFQIIKPLVLHVILIIGIFHKDIVIGQPVSSAANPTVAVPDWETSAPLLPMNRLFPNRFWVLIPREVCHIPTSEAWRYPASEMSLMI
jgi:hypothetical protein